MKVLFISSMFYSPLHGSPEVGELALEERLRGRGVSRSDEGVCVLRITRCKYVVG